MKLSSYFFCGVFISFFSAHLIAQQPAMWQLTDEDGLASMTVYEVLQDKKGYIWLATARGLSRYDGRNFININTTGLLDEEIIVIREDSFGRIWFNNLSGQIGWVEDLQAHLFYLEDESENYLPMRFFIKDSILLVNYKNNDNTNKLISVSINKKKPPFSKKEIKGKDYRHYNMLNFDEKWYSKIEYKNKKLEMTYLENDSLMIKDLPLNETLDKKNKIFKIEIIDSNRSVYFSNSNGLYRYTESDQTIDTIYDCELGIANNYFMIDNHIWTVAKNGVFASDLNTGKVEQIVHGMDVNAFFRDRENSIWLATAGEGVFLIPDLDLKLYNAENSPFLKSGIYSLYFDTLNELLYAGFSEAYLATFQKEPFEVKNYKLPLSGRVTAIEKGTNENMWLGLDGGICVFNLNNENIDFKKSYMSLKRIKRDKEDNLWLGTSNYTMRLDKEQISNDLHGLTFSKSQILPKRTYGLGQDYLNRVWIGTTSGIYLYDQDHPKLLFEDSSNISYSVADIIVSEDSSVWIGTSGNGLLQIKDNQVIKQFTNDDGLVSNNCRSLYVDQNILYLGTDNGLSMIDIYTGEFENVSINNGLPSGEINAVIAKEGIVYLGTPKGLLVFEKVKLEKNKIAPPVVVSEMRVNGTLTDINQEHQLFYWQNTIDFQYEGLAYRTRGKETYEYRLLGLDDQWLRTDLRSARFHSLDAGTYEFQIKAINEDRVESAKPASITFAIHPPWWKTTWFYSGLILGLMGLSGGITFWRQRDLRNRDKVEQALMDRIQLLRTEALRTQMNPHFIYNALNAIQDFLLTNDHESALFYLAEFAEMIRQIFDYSSREFISLEEEVQFLQLYLNLEKLRFGDRVNIICSIDDNLKIKLEEFKIPPLLIQPLIENAFKHGLMHKLKDGELQVSFEMKNNKQIKCTVLDNGIGRIAAKKYGKWKNTKRRLSGMEATRERLKIWREATNKRKELIITDLKDKNGKALGTKIEIFI